MMSPQTRIVVVGAGYAGLGAALRLARHLDDRATISLIDGRAEHQLITHLHEVAVARLAPAAAAIPLPDLLRGRAIHWQRSWVEGIDLQRGSVATDHGPVDYDALILAPGSETDYEGVPGSADFALPLRTLEDALRLRAQLPIRIAQAARAESSRAREVQFTFLVAGGGYTGVELAAELASWLPRLTRQFGQEASAVRIGLLESASHLLPGHDRWLGRRAAEILEELGVQVFLDMRVQAVAADGVQIDQGHIRAGTVIWTSGLRAPRWLAESGLEVGQAGRVRVDSWLAAIGYPEVMVIGDAAVADDGSEAAIPASAQVAVQQAAVAADNLAAERYGRPARAFRPHVLGEALSLGPCRGLASIGGFLLNDSPAVLVKRLADARYLEQLGGARLGLAQCARQLAWSWTLEADAAQRIGSRHGRGQLQSVNLA